VSDRSRRPRPGRLRRRDRHGRGLRGPLAPSHIPIAKSRAERFDDLVLDAVDRLRPRWGRQLASVEFAVEEVPPPSELVDGPARLSSDPVPFGRAEPASATQPATVIVYRRPLEIRARDHEQLSALVFDVVVEQVANLLGLAPETIAPGYDERH